MPNIVWFRRDFRLHDNTALYHAARDAADGVVVPAFVFDDAILRHPDTGGAIVKFMTDCLATLRDHFAAAGVTMLFLHGDPVRQIPALAEAVGASGVYFNKDYHPSAVERDDAVRAALAKRAVDARAFKDQVIFEEREILAASTGEPYTVYSPYARAWRARLVETCGGEGPKVWNRPKLQPWRPPPRWAVAGINVVELYGPESLGFRDAPPRIEIAAGEDAGRKMLKAFAAGPIRHYKQRRNLPADPEGTSRLSPHLRHGTLSPRQCLRAATYVMNQNPAYREGADAWIGELIWREFYQQILFNFPHVVDSAFKRKLADLPWEFDEASWRTWCEGRTGYPIVDAAMRQLNQTGWMHNRLRMIVAMFLTKDLRIDYRRGERYFMQKLIDGETAQNNGGWQWSASTGTDAQPYFRIFNPASQSEKFDPDGAFIRQFVPELRNVPATFIHAPHEMTAAQQQASGCVIGRDYPAPVVDHDAERRRTLAMFEAAR